MTICSALSLALAFITFIASVTALSYHSADFEGLVNTLPKHISQELGSRTRGALLSGGEAASVLSFGKLHPSEIPDPAKRADVLSVPIAQAGLCIGYNASHFGQEVAFTVDQVGWLFRGTGAPFALNPSASTTSYTRHHHTNTRVFVSRQSQVLLEELAATLVGLVEAKSSPSRGSVGGDDPGYTGPLFDIPSIEALVKLGSDVEAAFKLSGNLQWVQTDAEAVQLAKATANAVALISSVSSLQHRLRCAGIRVPHPKYMDENLQVSARPYLSGATTTIYTNNTVRTTSTLEPLTPLTITAYVHISKIYACHKDNNIWFMQLGEILDGDMLLNWNLARPSLSQTINSITQMMNEGLCAATKKVEASGASSASNIVAVWNLVYLQETIASWQVVPGEAPPQTAAPSDGSINNKTELIARAAETPLTVNDVFMIHYEAERSGSVLESFKQTPEAFRMNVVVSDIPPSHSDFESAEALAVTPLAAWPLSIVYNLKAVSTNELTLPFCTVLDIFAGRRRFWDDAEVADANPTILMPHVPIQIVARSGSSGATHVLFEGLSVIQQACPGGTDLFRAGESDFNASSAAPKSGVIFADSTQELLRIVDNTPFSVGYAFSGGDGVTKAVLQDANFLQLRPDVSAVLQRATLSPQSVLSIPRNGSFYPFVGVSYAIYLKHMSGGSHSSATSTEDRRRAEVNYDICVAVKALFTFMHWMATNPTASAVAASIGYSPIPPVMTTLTDERIRAVTCDGRFLLPQLPTSESSPQWLLGIYIGIPVAAVVVLFILKIVFSGKDNKYAPKGSSCCFVFTDIESSTTLWGRAPDLMGAALDLHNDVIRECIKRNKVYEVKTIGDSFMVAAETGEQGIQFALDVQQALMDAPWDEDAVEEFQKTYSELHAEKGWALLQSDIDTSLWRGLRIRTAINYGEVAVSQDPQHYGYDYHGPTVNKAARLESIGHGGQIIVSREVAETSSDYLKANSVIQHNLDDVLLRGMDEKVAISQISSSRFSRRQFATLRLEKQRDHSDSDLTDTTTAVASSQVSQGVDLSDYPNVNAYAMLHTLVGPLKQSKAKSILEVLTAAWRVPMDSVKNAKTVLAHKVGSAAAGFDSGGGYSFTKSRTRGSIRSMSRSGSESAQGGRYRVYGDTSGHPLDLSGSMSHGALTPPQDGLELQ